MANGKEQTEQKEPAKLLENRFGLASYLSNVWRVTTPDGVSEDDILRPEFWAHVAGKIRPCDEIIVVPDDQKFRLHLFVTDAGKQWVKVEKIGRIDFKTADAAPDASHAVKWRGPVAKWSVIRKSDGAVIRDRLESDDAAQQYARDLDRTLAA